MRQPRYAPLQPCSTSLKVEAPGVERGSGDVAESAGASRRAVSGEESGFAGAEGGAATAQEDAGTSRGCSNVASGPTLAELVELVGAAIVALDAGEADIARARLQALAEAVRILRHGCGEMALTGVGGKKGLDDPCRRER